MPSDASARADGFPVQLSSGKSLQCGQICEYCHGWPRCLFLFLNRLLFGAFKYSPETWGGGYPVGTKKKMLGVTQDTECFL